MHSLFGRLKIMLTYPQWRSLTEAAGIIVLGGYTGNGMISADRQEPQISGAGERFIKAVELARLYPKKQVWFSGFSGQLNPTGWSEAEKHCLSAAPTWSARDPFFI